MGVQLDKLKTTESANVGLIFIEEYNKPATLQWGGKKATKIHVEADKSRHRILLQKTLVQNKDTLSKPKFFVDSPIDIDPENQSEDLVIVSVKTSPMTVTIPDSTPQICAFQDGNTKTEIIVTITFCAEDSEVLWHQWVSGQDPIELLEKRMTSRMKQYCASITLGDLISPNDLIEVRTNIILKKAAKQAQEELKESLQKAGVDGLKLLNVDVTLVIQTASDMTDITTQLDDLRVDLGMDDNTLTNMRNIDKAFDRRKFIDRLLDNDMRFMPLSLRQMVMVVDPSLLEEFYGGQWDSTIAKLNEHLKKAQVGLAETNGIETLKSWIKDAQEAGVDEAELEEMRKKLATAIATNIQSGLHMKRQKFETIFKVLTGTATLPTKRIPQLGQNGQNGSDITVDNVEPDSDDD